MPHTSPQTPVDKILEEQQSLTAVERFARHHETHGSPAQSKYYRDLIPLTKPQAGQQYSFEVDLDRCSGCQACVTACHSLNGLDEDESWRDVGLLFSDNPKVPHQATVTTACHHCVDPGCLTGCPVLAYDKDPLTGIVKHLDDQCIGCQYCVMKCPYEVPQYSSKRGIVRKCDMCSSRLEHGEAPACVQACPTLAIRITLVDQAELARAFRGSPGRSFLPTAPSPVHTVPTTRYVSANPLPRDLIAGDQMRVVPADPHLPLVAMLVLSQLAAGSALAALFQRETPIFALAASVSGSAAIALAALHLGKPLKAWRAFLGWRTSWFSREVIAFGTFLPLAAASAASHAVPQLARFQGVLAWTAAAAGLGGVACSAMIYVDTHREFWSGARTFGRFLGSTVLLGAAFALAVAAWTLQAGPTVVCGLAAATSLAAAAKIALEQMIFRHRAPADEPATTSLARSAFLLDGPLSLRWRLRVFCAVLGGMVLPATAALSMAAGAGNPAGSATAALSLCLAGELLERHLFFTAVAPDRMPGGRSA